VSLAADNHLGDSPLLVVFQAGNDKLITLIQRVAPQETWEKLKRKVRLDGHTLLTTSIQSKNTYLLHRAIAQPCFSLLRPQLFRKAMGTWVTYPHLIAKSTVFRLLATLTANPNSS
jgi:hypothetical protein